MILNDYSNKGIGTEAVKQICPIAFKVLSLEQITANVFHPNIASIRVLQKNGFKYKGAIPNAVIKGGNVYDLLTYELSKDYMNQQKLWRIAFMMLAAFSLASCKPSARQTAADAEQPTDSTEAVTSAGTLRLVITDKHLSQTDSLIRRILRLPLDSITVEIVNNTESTCITGEAYTIEQRVNDVIHVEPDKYNFERRQKYRIVKEFFKSGQSNPQSAYCNFTIE